VGVNPVAGASARPNEITYSEDRLNPHLPPEAPLDVQAAGNAVVPPIDDDLLPAELPSPGTASQPTDPGLGLQGMMVPPDASPPPPAAPPPAGTP